MKDDRRAAENQRPQAKCERPGRASRFGSTSVGATIAATISDGRLDPAGLRLAANLGVVRIHPVLA